MNNIHIIHGIQYLQNIKYNTSFLCDLSSSPVVCCNMASSHGCIHFLLESKDVGKKKSMVNIHIEN